MIYDTIDHLLEYSSVIEHLDVVLKHIQEPWEVGSQSLNGVRIRRAANAFAPFSHQFTASKNAVTVHVVLAGKELVASTYHELSKGKKSDQEGYLFIEDAPVAAALTLTEGDFVIFMPTEPYCFGIQTEEAATELRTLTLEIEIS
jgi:beta-galactosidase beta subunit